MLQKLGEGGMGAVWLCEDMLLRRKVALKTLFADRNSVTEEDLERFRREVAIAHAVNHPGVARTYDLGESAGVHYLTMEYLEGETLVDRIKRGEPMTSDELRAIAVPLCKGLRAAHRAGVVHRDLKPANIMLVRDERRAVIMDFGIATAMDEPQAETEEPVHQAVNVPWEVTSAGRGTPTYMAPEQWTGQRGDARTDIYALGIILYVCLTKKVPYKAATAQELAQLHTSAPVPKVEALAHGVDPDLAKLITQCLAKRPEDRPASMNEVVERLTRGERRKQRSLQVLGVAAGSAALLSLVGLGLWSMAHGAVIREMRPAQARLAEVVALQLDAADLDQLRVKADIDSPVFKKVHGVMERYHKRYPELMGMYAMRATEVPDKYTIIADLFPRDTDRNGDGEISEEEHGAPPGTPYDGSDSPHMAEALRSDAPVADEDFTADAWGLSLSGYAAVLQDGVRTRYFVGADARNTPLASFQLRLVVILALSWLVMVVGFAIARYRLDKKRLSRESE